MHRVLALIITICVLTAAVAHGGELESALMKELLAAQRYEAGLTLEGISGLMMTASTEALVQGEWFISVNGFLDPTEDDVATNDFGLGISMSLGLFEDVWGPFKNFEIAASIPLYGTEVGEDAETGLGDAVITGKLQWIEFDPLRPEMPSISFIGSAILPTGDEQFTILDTGGIEAGMVFGTKVPDSSGEVDFRIYLEILAAYYDYPGEQDLFYKSNIGLSFPMQEIPDAFLMIEMGRISRNDNNDDGAKYAVSIRHQTYERNLTVGFTIRSYDEGYATKRQVYLTYDYKF